MITRQRFRILVGSGALVALLGAIPGAAQSGGARDGFIDPVPGAGESTAPNALEKGRFAILIDLDENRLYFKRGEETLWSAPVGTGTGMRVITHEDDWHFTTPTGRFQVQYKERDPVWIAPDWYFVENNLPVPSVNHSSRYMRGTLGDAAVYISPSLAIHGTDRPELIGQRVSHGCIRLENRYARRLYHNVQVGTEVIIIGGEEVLENTRLVDLRDGYDPSLAPRARTRPPAVDKVYEAWMKSSTTAVIEELDEQLALPAGESRWDMLATLLLDRGVEEDDRALGALFERAASLPTQGIEQEWGTYLADAYRGSTIRTLRVLGRLPLRQRSAAAKMLVNAALTLYAGDLASPAAPWPTGRLPEEVVPSGALRGWEALRLAEAEERTMIRTAARPE